MIKKDVLGENIKKSSRPKGIIEHICIYISNVESGKGRARGLRVYSTLVRSNAQIFSISTLRLDGQTVCRRDDIYCVNTKGSVKLKYFMVTCVPGNTGWVTYVLIPY